MFIEYLWEWPEYYFSWVLIVCFSICVHECSHTFFAHAQGDPTAYNEGYLTLNPLKVMGSYSLAALALLGLAWASVPVDKGRLRHGAAASAIISFAGPGANLVLALLFSFLLAIVQAAGDDTAGAYRTFSFVFGVGAKANAFLCLLNILPVPFLDGWDILTYFVPQAKQINMQTQGYITLTVILALIFLGGFAFLFQFADMFRNTSTRFFLSVLGAA